MFARLTGYLRRHKNAEEKIAEGVAVGVGVGLLRQVMRYVGVGLGAAAASAAIMLSTQTSTYHPSYALSAKAIAFLERHEGVRYQPYDDPGGKHLCTVGVGHVMSWTGPCTAAQLRETFTPAQVAALLRTDASSAMRGVSERVTAHITQFEYEALVDLAFNAGPGSLDWGHSNSLTNEVNSGRLSSVPVTLAKTATTASGVFLGGLYQRRLDEGLLFSRGYYGAGIGYFVTPKPLTAAEKAEAALRAKTGYYGWLAWYLHEGAWKPYAVHATIVRPHIPKTISAAWWRRERAFVTERSKTA